MLKIENVSKRYNLGKKEALSDISFTVEQGEFIALLGQNGAGKSTLINILAGNVKKNSGRVTIGGYDLDRDELKIKKIIGIVPQEISFDFLFSVNEVLRNQSGYFGIKNNEHYIDELLRNLSLYDKKNVQSRILSGGMKRRLLIAKALVHKPRLLILDEPTAGVDVELRQSLYAFLKRLHNEGITIILTTHYLEEAEKLCDRVIMINQGKLIVDESMNTLLETIGAETLMEFHFDSELKTEDFSFLADYSPQIKNRTILQLRALIHDIGNIFQKMREENMHYINFKLEPKKLEDVFLQLVGN